MPVSHYHHTAIISLLKSRPQMPILPIVRDPFMSRNIFCLIVKKGSHFWCFTFKKTTLLIVFSVAFIMCCFCPGTLPIYWWWCLVSLPWFSSVWLLKLLKTTGKSTNYMVLKNSSLSYKTLRKLVFSTKILVRA